LIIFKETKTQKRPLQKQVIMVTKLK